MQSREFVRSLRRNLTDAERLLWRHLRAHRFLDQKFRRQHPIGSYVVDFVHLGAKLIVEADGGQHGSASDEARDAWLGDRGYRVLRFWNDQILGDIDAVLEAILKALGEVAPSHPAPLPPGERGEITASIEEYE